MKSSKHYIITPSQQEREQALEFLNTWSNRPPVNRAEERLQDDVRAKAIWDKYTQVE